MSERPCDDLDCRCCWPDLTCLCSRRPFGTAGAGAVHTCPDCGAIWLAVSYEQAPEAVRRARQRSLLAIARACGVLGREVPEQSGVFWRQVLPAVRIPGSVRP